MTLLPSSAETKPLARPNRAFVQARLAVWPVGVPRGREKMVAAVPTPSLSP
jgi:hypothetical protein